MPQFGEFWPKLKTSQHRVEPFAPFLLADQILCHSELKKLLESEAADRQSRFQGRLLVIDPCGR